VRGNFVGLLLVGAWLVTSKQSARGAEPLHEIQALNPHLAFHGDMAWPMKVHSLLKNEYNFFRGTADLFYRFCGEHCADWISARGKWVSLHGDVHLGNIGTYQGPGAPGEDIHFGLVDFDEAVRGPYELDLLRATTALRFAAGASEVKVSDEEMRQAISTMVFAYVGAREGKTATGAWDERHPCLKELFKEARSGTMKKYVKKYAEGDPLRFKSRRESGGSVEDVMRPLTAEKRAAMIDAVWTYIEKGLSEATRKRFRFKDHAELQAAVLDAVDWTRVGSSGSQGLQKYLVLLASPLVESEDPLILQLKEEPIPGAVRARLLEADSGSGGRGAFVAEAYQKLNDPTVWLIGHTQIGDKEFLVKTKDCWSEELSSDDVKSVESLNDVAAVMGEVIGRSHRLGGARGNVFAGTDGGKQQWALDRELADRSKAAHDYLHAAYESLREDPRSKEFRKKAEEWLKNGE